MKELSLTSPSAITGATLSDCKKYRYFLYRRWGPQPWVLWVMYNPSKADANTSDPTITKCIGFSERLGFGGIGVINPYGFRSAHPSALWSDGVDPIGADNDRIIMETLALKKHARVIVAWGASGGRRASDRKRDLLKMIRFYDYKPMCFGVTKEGEPRHPLMLPYTTALTPFRETAKGGTC